MLESRCQVINLLKLNLCDWILECNLDYFRVYLLTKGQLVCYVQI